MSNERIAIVSARLDVVHPSQTCASEFEDVLAAMLEAPIIRALADPDGVVEIGFDRLIYVAINYWQLSRLLQRSKALQRRSGPSYAFVFDANHHYLHRWTNRFPVVMRPLVRLGRHELRTIGRIERIFMPVGELVEEQQVYLNVPINYLPIGVDAVRYGSQRTDRSIDVNGYGRQPPRISGFLSDRINVRGGKYSYYHTDCISLDRLTDPIRYRRLFWRMLADSRLALAYTGEAYDPTGRFDAPLVGQRWYESAAAGCAIVGRAPTSDDAARLFDWEDATIELPEEPDEAWSAIRSLLDNPERIIAIGRRNHYQALTRHDWRHRIEAMATVLRLERGAAFRNELARATIPLISAEKEGSAPLV
jgi:hypothetical protein